ncbi:hypothetical protein C8Q76DRAFT_131353 [Earliella scabrosa]|nr:hypothetical protein C8Q76DRAFT_131353 [Earliella scabrosa]
MSPVDEMLRKLISGCPAQERVEADASIIKNVPPPSLSGMFGGVSNVPALRPTTRQATPGPSRTRPRSPTPTTVQPPPPPIAVVEGQGKLHSDPSGDDDGYEDEYYDGGYYDDEDVDDEYEVSFTPRPGQYQVTNNAADAGPAMDAKGKRRARSPYYEYHYPSSLGTTILSVDEHPITPPHLPFIYPAREPCVVIDVPAFGPSRSGFFTGLYAPPLPALYSPYSMGPYIRGGAIADECECTICVRALARRLEDNMFRQENVSKAASAEVAMESPLSPPPLEFAWTPPSCTTGPMASTSPSGATRRPYDHMFMGPDMLVTPPGLSSGMPTGDGAGGASTSGTAKSKEFWAVDETRDGPSTVPSSSTTELLTAGILSSEDLN